MDGGWEREEGLMDGWREGRRGEGRRGEGGRGREGGRKGTECPFTEYSCTLSVPWGRIELWKHLKNQMKELVKRTLEISQNLLSQFAVSIQYYSISQGHLAGEVTYHH